MTWAAPLLRAVARTNGVSEEGLDSYVHAWALSISAQGDAAGTAIETDGMEPNPNQVDTSTPVVPSDILVDDLASSDNMYHLIDPMLNKCTAQQPIAVNTAIVASTGVQVVSASIDPNLNHFDYYNQLLSSDCGNVSATAALACARAYVNFVSINGARPERATAGRRRALKRGCNNQLRIACPACNNQLRIACPT